MLNEFYDYIANNTLSFFQRRIATLQPGERYCLKLDNEEMVLGVDKALRKITALNNIQGKFNYGNVYSTFTIKLASELEIVVASKINKMTDDFLATLRNAEMTEKHFPILMITHSTIDTISSGTGNLASKGMPFHASTIITKIKDDINSAELSIQVRTLLEMELKRKQNDRFTDKSSLYEYSDLLTVLGRGYMEDRDYPLFNLLPDPEAALFSDVKKIRARFEDNRNLFELIDRAVKHGNIIEDLEKEFERKFVEELKKRKKNNVPWYDGLTYAMVKAAQDKLKRKLDNPLQINDIDFTVYSGTPLEYTFESDEYFFIRDDGDSKAKRRRKNILIFNPDHKDTVTISLRTNIAVKLAWITCNACFLSISGKEIKISIKPKGCTFAQVKITDINNNFSYILKICVVNVQPRYLENIRTLYIINTPKNLAKSRIQLYGVNSKLVINPDNGTQLHVDATDNAIFECNYYQTLSIKITDESIDPDTGCMNCIIKCGDILIPLQILDAIVKPVEITGIGAFKLKNTFKKSLEYRDGKIIAGTKEFFTKEPFKTYLAFENQFIENEWCAINKTAVGLNGRALMIPDNVYEAYVGFIRLIKKKRTLPSLVFYEGEILEAAQKYVNAVITAFNSIKPGETLTNQLNDMLFLGCTIKEFDEESVEMSPLHPLNVLYQIKLLGEQGVGVVRDNLIEKLTSLYLIPFIKDANRKLYQTIEQKHSPEWRFYAPISNKRFHGARNFVQKLVYDKILQYKEHFSFLFDDIGNNQIIINLVNMGDCREIFQGLLKLYTQSLQEGVEQDDLMCFIVNIYADSALYNEFTILSDQYKLKEYIQDLYPNDDTSELVLAVTGKIHCYFRNPNEEQYQYAHLTFYEMTSSEDTGASRMDNITTGISLEGIISGIPSVLNAKWYKTGFGTKYAKQNELIELATRYNALYRVAFSGSSYEPNSSIFTEIDQGQEGQLGKIYSSSNWVVFVAPKVDLTFFQKKASQDSELMIIHYSDQYTSASGYDDITVTKKTGQYSEIIYEQLMKKGVSAETDNIKDIISLFNAVNGGWLLRLITAKKLTGAADSFFSREKMSILSAIKVCMAYYSHPDIVWIPVSLEEMLRVSGGAGLSQKEGILSAKNLGFEQRATSDDILLVGVEGPSDHIKIYLHPVEVKIGQNSASVISKANNQVINTYNGLWNALWPKEEKDILERKLSRNFFIQLLIVCCEKLNLYNIYPNESWDDVLHVYRENLLNEQYVISDAMDQYIGKGTVISFGTDVLNKKGSRTNDICLLEFPEKMGSSYMVLSAESIEKDLEISATDLPIRLKEIYKKYDGDKQSSPEIGVVSTDCTSIKTEIPTLSVDPSQTEEIVYPEGEQNDEEVAEVKTDVKSVLDYPVVKDTVSEEPKEPQKTQETQETVCINKTGMKVLLGTDITNGNTICWYPNNTNKLFHTNTGIIGTMGTGKTQFTKSLITQLYRDQANNIGDKPLGILVFDYKGDYNESKEDFINATKAKVLKPYHLPFNPLSLTKSKVFKPLLPIHTANAFKDTLAKVYGLGPKQQNTLFQCIIEAYKVNGIEAPKQETWNNTPPTFDMVYQIYANDEEIKKNDSLAAAMDKLYQFQIFEGDPEATVSLFDLLNEVVVIDLSGYDADIQTLIVAITLDLFYSQMQASGSSKLDGQFRQLTKLILVDEADNFMSEGFPSLKKILKEGREFGVGTILSTQFLEHFGSSEDDYSKYILTWVVHNVADLKLSDVEFVFKVESKSQESQILFNDIKSLKKHHSIIKIGNEKPIYVTDKAFWELYKELKID